MPAHGTSAYDPKRTFVTSNRGKSPHLGDPIVRMLSTQSSLGGLEAERIGHSQDRHRKDGQAYRDQRRSAGEADFEHT
jgi:hypothetical protein